VYYRYLKALEDVYRKSAIQEFRRKREKLALDSVRIGKIATLKNGASCYDVFEEGYATKDLNKRIADLISAKDKCEADKKLLNNLKLKNKKKAMSLNVIANEGGLVSFVNDDSMITDNTEIDILAATESLKVRQDALKK
jgi:hypothetical protein